MNTAGRTYRIRPAAVAGVFYPAEPAALRQVVERCLAAAQTPGPVPKAIVVPHAGYIYSGPVAGSAYVRLAAARERIRRVVLLGPSHQVWFKGLALPEADAFDTPLGRVVVDAEARDRVAILPGVRISDRPHRSEHSLEVQLPFLQVVLSDFRLVPFAVGDADPAEVAAVLREAWGGAETLIAVSTDLSHYHPYADAQRLDARTCRRILALDPTLDGHNACGCAPLNGLLQLARSTGLKPLQLDLRNSGDTAGDRARVVGYAAFAFHEPDTAIA
jgi:hypothetical protein